MSGAHWESGALRSPISGRALMAQGERLLVGGDETWPVIDGIPFLRANRRDMARAAVDLIRNDDVVAATALLLTDQDPYAPDPPPSRAECERLVRAASSLTFRAAMQALRFGRVADYFTHRWTDPTFLSGLALLDHALAAGQSSGVFELACGAGHFLAALRDIGVEAAGGDLVFAKLWLARQYVSPSARLVCFEADAAWPLADGAARTVFCHDAFYFLPDKAGVAVRMRRLAGAGGTVAIGHAHNAAVDNHSAGGPLSVDGYAALFPGASLFDDLDLTQAFVDDRSAETCELPTLQSAAALSLLWRDDGAYGPPVWHRRFGDEPSSQPVRLNPLYSQEEDGAQIVWPSRRYEQEYGPLVSYPMRWAGPDALDRSDPAAAELLRRRVYVALPPRW